MHLVEIFVGAYKSYAQYVFNEFTFGNPLGRNYFFWLIILSFFFFLLEIFRPWRVSQPRFRKDFWLDFFYMFFNFFIFSLLIYHAGSEVVIEIINLLVSSTLGVNIATFNPLQVFPYWAVMLIGFTARDLIQWCIHRLLHRLPRLWEFHKVHHSVAQMGFAAHLRYHWMETVIYRTLEYFPLALLGIGLHDFFVMHIFTLAWGHFNHSNINLNRGLLAGLFTVFIAGLIVFTETSWPLWAQLSTVLSIGVVGAVIFRKRVGFLLNSPQMHIWHHARHLPREHPHGVNYGLTLAIWDYLFGTAYVPSDGRDIPLGFEDMDHFPSTFVSQSILGFTSSKKEGI